MNPPAHPDAHTLDALDIDTAFKVAFAGFLHLGEFTYEASDRRNRAYFRISIISETHAILHLRRSKRVYQHHGVTIPLARTGTKTCPATALEAFKRFHPADDDEPLFQLQLSPFNRAAVRNALKNRLKQAGILEDGYTGHGFRKGAAQSAADNRLTKGEIQLLGRWSSDVVERYFKHNRQKHLRLHSSCSPVLNERYSSVHRRLPSPPAVDGASTSWASFHLHWAAPHALWGRPGSRDRHPQEAWILSTTSLSPIPEAREVLRVRPGECLGAAPATSVRMKTFHA